MTLLDMQSSGSETQKEPTRSQKHRKGQAYADLAVQGTNDYSIVSKRSVEKLYAPILNKHSPHYFQHFVKKPSRRSPCINRGYWTRMEAIKRSIFKIIRESLAEHKKVVVINLGAGYDPLAFQFLDPLNPENREHNGNLSFIDVDYFDLNKHKIDMIRKSRELCEIIGEETYPSYNGLDLKTDNYIVLSCNLKDTESFLEQLRHLKLEDETVTKIYIAEVSIAYMLPEFADPIIAATSELPNSHFLLLEQILPKGEYQPFARSMLHHFSKLDTPLNSVKTYSTISKQIERFKAAGYKSVEAQDLFDYWRSLPLDVREKVSSVEEFDELEEFVLFGQHYLILHATDTNFQLFAKSHDSFNFTIEQAACNDKPFYLRKGHPELQRKFPAALSTSENIIFHGGSYNTRLNTIMSLNQITILKHKTLPRMSHTFTPLGGNRYLLVGGRNSPNTHFSQCDVLMENDSFHQWHEAPSLPEPRSRHNAVSVDDGVLVYGGNFKAPPFILFENNCWVAPPLKGDILSKESSAIAYNGRTGVVIGGIDANGDFTSDLHTFRVVDGTIVIDLIFEHPLLSRYGAKAQFVSDEVVLLVGGVSNLESLGQQTSVVEINIERKTVTPIEVPDKVWKEFPLLVGFELLKYQNSLLCLGGGAVCYSFGSVWNPILVIGEDRNISEFHEEYNFQN